MKNEAEENYRGLADETIVGLAYISAKKDQELDALDPNERRRMDILIRIICAFAPSLKETRFLAECMADMAGELEKVDRKK